MPRKPTPPPVPSAVSQPPPAQSDAAEDTADALGPAPQSSEQLHQWLHSQMNIRVPRTALTSGHTPPFDYLLHSFFEGRGRWVAGTGESPLPHEADGGPADCIDQTGIGSANFLRRAGLPVRARRMSVQEGLSLIRARLKPADGPPRLLIHERCRRLIESLEKYHYHADRPESLHPVKDGNDHAVDALRYLLTNLDRPFKIDRGTYPA